MASRRILELNREDSAIPDQKKLHLLESMAVLDYGSLRAFMPVHPPTVICATLVHLNHL